MSVSSLEAPPTMPIMVSRLPKFGFQSKSASSSSGTHTGPATSADMTSTRLTNGFYHHPGPVGVNSSAAGSSPSVKQNGFLRVPVSFAVNCGQEHGGDEKSEAKRGNLCQNRSTNNRQVHPVPSQQSARTTAGKGRVLNHPATSASSRLPQSAPKTLPVSKGSSRLGQIAPNLTNGTKQAPNGPPASKPWTGRGGSLRRPQSFPHPGVSGSLFQTKQASRSHSSDDLGSAPSAQLTQSDRIRSQSLNQVRRQASPSLSPSPSSSSPVASTRYFLYSYNRSRLKPAPSSQGSARGISTISGQTPDGGSWGRSGISVPSLLPPSSLKKPLLPTIVPSSKNSGVSYKLSRPSLNKPLRPLRATPARPPIGEQEVNQTASVETAPTTGNIQSEGPTAETLTQKEEVEGETLDDMSLSSSSSLDPNHASQEYMDDFDNLGNGGVGILHLSINDENQSCAGFDQKAAVAKTTRLCFVDDGMECADMRLSGEPREQDLSPLHSRRRSSGLGDHDQGGSSLDLSPSDSCGSGGIYMWDEEGLDPLGGLTTTPGSNTTHPIGSFDSDLNTVDILTHLDSCDLDDDDLMLDADDSEASSLFSDGGGTSHMAEWTRRQLCWGTQEFDNHSERSFKLNEDTGNKKPDIDSELLLGFFPHRSDFLSLGFGADVEELAEDCCAVRSQLEHLQSLLLQDDDENKDTLSPEDSSHSSDSQVQALLQEVQQLREELRSRDQTIAHLTLQLAVPTATTRCRCQQTKGAVDCHTQTHITERESATPHAPRRENNLQVLQPSSQAEQNPVTRQSAAALPPQAKPRPHQPQSLEDGGQRRSGGKITERSGANARELQPPSKLRLFLSQKSTSAASRLLKRPPDPERKGSSRLPKPKI
eukprot:XP_011612382.1 PREDICTED: serine-rich coiled-coil domain-containing protein 2-like [Takifugu rubripes]